jgi:putative SOS response-associated peptidase YedK
MANGQSGLKTGTTITNLHHGSILRTVCVVTTSPNAVMESIHDRMPVIVALENWQSWLTGMPEEVTVLVSPYRDDELQAWPVSRRVSKTQDDDPGLIETIKVPV